MGGVDPPGGVRPRRSSRSGRSVVTANKQLVARRGAELFAAAAAAGVQLRFEASVCAAIPVIKVLRESLVVTNVHRVLGIVNGTTNFILTAMDGGQLVRRGARRGAAARLRRGRPDGRRRRRWTRPRRSRSSRRSPSARACRSTGSRSRGSRASRRSTSRPRARSTCASSCSAARRSSDGRVDVRVGPAFVDAHHPLAAVEGAFNAVMLQGDAIREITLEGPGRGRDRDRVAPSSPTWSRSSARPAPASCRTTRSGATLERMPPGELASPVVPPAPGRRPRRRARAPRAGARRGGRLGRPARPAAGDGDAVLAHRHARGARGPRRGRARGDPRAARVARRRERAARRLRARRRGARLGVTTPAAPESSSSGDDRPPHRALPRPAPGHGGDAGRVARRGLDAAAAAPRLAERRGVASSG